MARTSQPPTAKLAERWKQIAERHPKKASEISELAQALLGMDRITPEGAKRALQSQEMDTLVLILETHGDIRKALGLKSAKAEEIIRAIDLFAADIILDHEKKL